MPHAAFIDLIGQRFGELTVRHRAPNRYGRGARYTCTCSCGETCVVDSQALREGRTLRCPTCQQHYREIDMAARQRVAQGQTTLASEAMLKRKLHEHAQRDAQRVAEKVAQFVAIERAQIAGDLALAKQLLGSLMPRARQQYQRWRVARSLAAQRAKGKIDG